MGTAIYPLFDSSGNAIAPPGVSSGSDNTGNDSSGWLSGLSDLFAAAGAGVASGLKASNTPNVPTASGWIYNASTGQYYNAATGQAMTATGSLTSGGIFTGSNSNIIILALVALAAIFLFRRKG